MGDMSDHVKNNILNLGKPVPSKLKINSLGLPVIGSQKDDPDDLNNT
jgi:hypothetical protein